MPLVLCSEPKTRELTKPPTGLATAHLRTRWSHPTSFDVVSLVKSETIRESPSKASCTKSACAETEREKCQLTLEVRGFTCTNLRSKNVWIFQQNRYCPSCFWERCLLVLDWQAKVLKPIQSCDGVNRAVVDGVRPRFESAHPGNLTFSSSLRLLKEMSPADAGGGGWTFEYQPPPPPSESACRGRCALNISTLAFHWSTPTIMCLDRADKQALLVSMQTLQVPEELVGEHMCVPLAGFDMCLNLHYHHRWQI